MVGNNFLQAQGIEILQKRPYFPNVSLIEHLWMTLVGELMQEGRGQPQKNAHPGFAGGMEFHTAGDHPLEDYSAML